MKKFLLVVGGIGVMALAAACSSGGGSKGSWSSGTYNVTNGAFAGDGCNLASLGVDPTQLNATGVTMTITGNTMDFGGLILTGSGAVFSESTNDVLAINGTCSLDQATTIKLSASGTDKGTLKESANFTKDASSTDCSASPITVPCSSALQANVAKQ